MKTVYDDDRDVLINQILWATAELTGYLDAQRRATPPNRYDSPMVQECYLRGFAFGKMRLGGAPATEGDGA